MNNRPAPPRSHGELQKLVRRYVREEGLVERRVRDWISYMALAGALERGTTPDRMVPAFLVRGGVAMELRLGGRGRATRDIDITFAAAAPSEVDAFDDAVRPGYGRFRFLRTAPVRELARAETVRLELQVLFDGSHWGTIVVDLSRAEAHRLEVEPVAAFDLSGLFGLEGPATLPCLSARYHLAHKIHGATRPPTTEHPNDRVQDLVDILLLRPMVPDLAAARAACVEVFRARATHPWPPVFLPPADWALRYSVLAAELSLEWKELETGAGEVRRIVRAIDAATAVG